MLGLILFNKTYFSSPIVEASKKSTSAELILFLQFWSAPFNLVFMHPTVMITRLYLRTVPLTAPNLPLLSNSSFILRWDSSWVHWYFHGSFAVRILNFLISSLMRKLCGIFVVFVCVWHAKNDVWNPLDLFTWRQSADRIVCPCVSIHEDSGHHL